VLDRLVGFKLSPVLWKKVKGGLSAGRVQSVAVRIIVEREREIQDFQSAVDFRVTAHFMVNGNAFTADLKASFKTADEAGAFVSACVGATHTVSSLETKPGSRKPAAPFTTSSLQQEASRKLGFSVKRTMRVAQGLYESGSITYMRTDSTQLSELALDAAQEWVTQKYGSEYANRRQYTGKQAKGAQEAHEAIRPTDLDVADAGRDRDAERLYDLIRKRTLASQMTDAKLLNTTVQIATTNRPEYFMARGQVISFEGFLKVYAEGTDEENEENNDKKRLPEMEVGQALGCKQITARQRFGKPKTRYTEASLVREMESLGIGRPSTYAPTISTIQDRKYVELTDRDGNTREVEIIELLDGVVTRRTESEGFGAERKKLFPTDIGRVVTKFLLEHFKSIMDYNFTADVEEHFDVIAQGQLDWQQMMDGFYKPFEKDVKKCEEEAGRESGERILGPHPETGKTILVRIGRFGPLAQIGAPDDEEKQFASLLEGQSLETITIEQALELFKLPRKLGEHEGKVVTSAIGRFGPYVRYDGKFVSLKKDGDDDPFTITLERGVELIEAKIAADAKALLKTFTEDETVRIIEGRFGPFIKAGKKNVKIPKGEDPLSVDWGRVVVLIEEHDKRPPKRRGKKK
jgi:DNA topoisomerase I